VRDEVTDTPRYRADTVGSLLRPEAVQAARAQFRAGTIDAAELRQVEDAAICDVVRLQEELGLDVVTDGEFRRDNWYIDFVRKLHGVEIADGASTSFVPRDGQSRHVPKQVRTVGKIAAGAPILLDDYLHLASVRPGRSR
jgi:5-methyltetrahydropteroyltriglutamate--homocysteine methyltransferase